jgi:hypothetical protein
MDSLYIETNPGWKVTWENKLFRKKVYIGLLVFLIIFTCLPFFFFYIEQRRGILLNDWILRTIPPYNVSALIFICIWATLLLTLARAFKEPDFFLLMLYSYSMVCIFRYVTMSLVPLETPAGLIPLVDPLSNLFYGKKFITKDLFFSGHTSTLFLMHLCFKRKSDKYFSLITTILVGALVLIQHVHYTVDVIAAPIFTFIAFKITKKWISSWQLLG